ncbi:MAG: hypothetical protein H6658_08090 [Ardenticatenaceae bacterium]|nr:hypothetical protein [Ardenticatenaceae bacterium]
MIETNQYLYKIQPTRLAMVTDPTPEEAQIVGEHFQYLQDLTQKGVMILVGRTLNTDSSTFGIAIFQAGSDEEAQAIMHNDPAVQKGVMQAQLFPYRIALMQKGA